MPFSYQTGFNALIYAIVKAIEFVIRYVGILIAR